MKTKLALTAALVILMALLAYSQRRVSQLKEHLDFQTASIKSIGSGRANSDVSRGIATYILMGRIERNYVEAFDAHLQQYGIKPMSVGCVVTEAFQLYAEEYNQVIRQSLIKKHGKDIIREFDADWSNHSL